MKEDISYFSVYFHVQQLLTCLLPLPMQPRDSQLQWEKIEDGGREYDQHLQGVSILSEKQT